MTGETPSYSLFTRRAVVLGGGMLAATGVLAARLFYLQFIRSEDYTTLAEGNRVKLQLIPPPRGKILDRFGLPMAENHVNYRVFIEDAPVDQLKKTLARLERIIPLTDRQRSEIIEDAKSKRYAPPILIKEFLQWEELSAVEYDTPNLPGVYIEEGLVRHYPMIEQASHLIGHVGAVAEEDLTDQPLLRLPGFKIGKNGIEKTLESRLRGKAGVKQVEVNVHGQSARELKNTLPEAGEDVRITIDRRLQQYAAEQLQDESGAIVVMDVHNGDVLALVSMPGFDPNQFSRGITHNYWNQLMGNEKNPLLNKAIAGQYPPGSTFKMLVGLAALEEDIASASETVYCPGHFYLGKHRFNCWKAGGHGHMDARSAIAQSCDTYYYTMAQKLGIDAIAEVARKFGLGAPTGVALPGEKSGILPTEEWKRKTRGSGWRPGDTINAGIGQGYVLATPMQLAVMTARIANGGQMVSPRLTIDDSVSTERMDVDEEHLRVIQEGMFQVANTPRGTAYWKRITEPGLEMSGKTGTSQVRRITQRGLDQKLLPWKYRHHALFVGYAPTFNPRYAAAVIVEHGGGGASAAAPVARDVLLKVQELAKEDFVGPQLLPWLQGGGV